MPPEAAWNLSVAMTRLLQEHHLTFRGAQTDDGEVSALSRGVVNVRSTMEEFLRRSAQPVVDVIFSDIGECLGTLDAIAGIRSPLTVTVDAEVRIIAPLGHLVGLVDSSQSHWGIDNCIRLAGARKSSSSNGNRPQQQFVGLRGRVLAVDAALGFAAVSICRKGGKMPNTVLEEPFFLKRVVPMLQSVSYTHLTLPTIYSV